MEFKIGDRVRVVRIEVDPEYTSPAVVGCEGVVTDNPSHMPMCPVGVLLSGDRFRSFFTENELEKIT